MANPFDQFDTQGAPLPSPPLPADKVADQRRDDEKLGIERRRLQLAERDDQRQQQQESDKQTKYDDARKSGIDMISRVLGQIDELARSVHSHEGWWQLGKTGAMARGDWPIVGKIGYPGSDAANFDSALSPIISNTAFQKLQEMRQNSPTGGAVGNVSDADMKLLQSTIASLSPDQDYNSFMRNLAQTKDAYLRMLGKLDSNQAHSVLDREGVWHVPSGGYYYGKLPKAGQDHHRAQNRPPLDSIFGSK